MNRTFVNQGNELIKLFLNVFVSVFGPTLVNCRNCNHIFRNTNEHITHHLVFKDKFISTSNFPVQFMPIGRCARHKIIYAENENIARNGLINYEDKYVYYFLMDSIYDLFVAVAGVIIKKF